MDPSELAALLRFRRVERAHALTTLSSISAPSVDGDLIPAQPYDLLQQGKFQRKPFLSGNVKDEGTLFLYQNLTSSDDFTAYAAGLYNNDTAIVEQILQLYPDDPSLGR